VQSLPSRFLVAPGAAQDLTSPSKISQPGRAAQLTAADTDFVTRTQQVRLSQQRPDWMSASLPPSICAALLRSGALERRNVASDVVANGMHTHSSWAHHTVDLVVAHLAQG
jgi:hypothetical protein